jgi:hypothetical protein
MENVLITLTLTCCFLAGFAGFLGLFGFLRYLRYQETIQLAEKGLVKPVNGGNGKGALRWGLAITGLGVALSAGLYPIGFLPDISGQFPLNFGPWMLAGLIPVFFGLSLIAIYLFTRKEEEGENRVGGIHGRLDSSEGGLTDGDIEDS